MTDSNGDKLLLVRTAARRLGVTDQHVRRLVRQGRLRGVRLSPRGLKIPEAALREYQEALNDMRLD